MYLFWILTGIFAVSTIHGNVQDKDMYKDLYYSEEMDHDVEEAQEYPEYQIPPDNNDGMVEKEIQRIEKENDEIMDDEYNDESENIDDYQIEDNRSEVKDDYVVMVENEGQVDNKQAEEKDAKNDAGTKQAKASEEVENVKNDVKNDEPSDAQKKIIDETSALLNEDSDSDYDDEFGVLNKINDTNIDEAVEETKKLLEEDADDDFALDKSANFEDIKNGIDRKVLEADLDDEEIESPEDTKLDDAVKDVDGTNESSKMVYDEVDSGEDTVDKAYGDLIDDLNRLRETWKKLNDDVDDAEINEEELPGFDEIKNKMFDMENAAHEDYEEVDDKNLSKIFEEFSEKSNEEFEDTEGLEYEEDADDGEIVKASTNKTTKQPPSAEVTESTKLIHYVDDALVANDTTETSSESSTEKATVKVHDVEPLDFGTDKSVDTITNLFDETTTLTASATPIDYSSNLTDAGEFNGIINPGAGNTILKANSIRPMVIDEESIIEPTKIKLSLDEPVIVTSPNYPDPYPTNALFDWFLEGEGMGIEFNVTDFAVNGLNDFLLVQPGRDNPSGLDGLIFSHRLNEIRRYRFLNVNKMFMRFRTMPGMRWQRGFNVSIQLIAPVPEIKPEEPTEDPGMVPEYTFAVNLAMPLSNFSEVEEDFRLVIADMATMYITANNIDAGLEATRNVAVIRSTELCFLNWPNSDDCCVIGFGVPLRYKFSDDIDYRLNEEDLADMWQTYSTQDPFATRLARLGISEFVVPDDNNVLMVWLVIAAGVVISMAMLAFALWRFSCFEEYTKMPAFSDTESVNEKKTLDLYPTPHQTLPPLYAEAEYKWDPKYDEASRVHMGGFTNRNYERTEEYDIESDEEVAVPARDRNGSISREDGYIV